LKFADNAKFANYSFLSSGAGMETVYGGYWNDVGELDHLSLSVTGGGDLELFNSELGVYKSSTVSIPGRYATDLLNLESVFSGFLDPTNLAIPLGANVLPGIENSVNGLLESVEYEEPLQLLNTEHRGVGTEFDFKFSLSAGVGLDLGLTFRYLDELEYPTNYVEIYKDGLNLPIRSTSYNENMRETTLSEILIELVSGTEPLVKEALSNLLNVIEDAIRAGEEVIVNAINKSSKAVGRVVARFENSGQLITSVFSPTSNRVRQKAFETPVIRNMYSNPNVFYELPAKSLNENENILSKSGAELIVISDVMDLVFIPEGSNDSLSVVDQPIEIEMTIHESDLDDNDFTQEDKANISLYRYLTNEVGWVRVGGELNDDNISADITKLGSYALGIEINRSDDSIAPDIYETGYLDASNNGGVDEIFARIRDDKYGIGVDFGNTFMIVNGDTVSYSYQPASERIFFDLNGYSNLNGESEDVKIVATDFNGNQTTTTFSFEQITTTTDDKSVLPDRFLLHDNYPNPFNPQTVIPFELAEAAHVEINIYDVAGRYITTLLNERLTAGNHQVSWNTSVGQGRELSSGVYFYQVKSGTFNQVKKMMLIK